MNFGFRGSSAGSVIRRRIAGISALVLVLPVACLFQAGPAFSRESAAGVAARLQQRYASVETVTADFQQSFRGPGVDIVESGTFLMKKPGLMRWEYRDPETKLFVSDGHDTYLYTPADRQVMVRRFSPEELHSTPLEFLLGRGDLFKTFRVSEETQVMPKVAGTVLIRLVPVEYNPDYQYFVLECDSGTSDLRRIVIHEQNGNNTEFLLTNLQTNVRVNSKSFDFKIPKGVEVIRLDEKDD